MAELKGSKEERLAWARALLNGIEADNDEEVNRILDDLVRSHDASLFVELGKLTRDLHEALNSFRLDSRIARLTQDEIPDAKDRLNYVITMTEQAANRTLTAVEETLPVSEEMEQRAKALRENWTRFRNRNMSVEEFRTLAREIDEFLAWTAEGAAQVHKNLSDVLMAQDFQDLTGQIIRRVIALVQEVEDNLVGLIRISGQRMTAEPSEAAGGKKDGRSELAGPQIPGKESADVVRGQDDVDELLSSLGF